MSVLENTSPLCDLLGAYKNMASWHVGILLRNMNTNKLFSKPKRRIQKKRDKRKMVLSSGEAKLIQASTKKTKTPYRLTV